MPIHFDFDRDAESKFRYTVENKLDELELAMREKLDNLNIELQRRIVSNLQGPILNQVTGKAARSVEMIPARTTGDVIEGSVQAGGPAFYLKFQEDGTSGPYEIVASKASALAFMMNGKLEFFKRVQHPGLKARHAIASTFEEFKPEIIAGLQAVPGEVGKNA